MLLKKSERAKLQLEEHAKKLQCPRCHSGFKVQTTSLICDNNHVFDISKKGTLFFLGHQVKTEYDTKMFTHRQKMIKSGLYDPLINFIKAHPSLVDAQSIVDIGCGEGSFLAELAKEKTGLMVGFDISKEGINMATNQDINALWWIADLTNVPLRDESVDILLNIFTPSHYQEFRRILAEDGLLIKVVPGSEYLKELREVFFAGQPEKIAYSNDEVIRKLEREMSVVQHEKIKYMFPIVASMCEDLLYMSPVHWGSSEEARAYILNEGIKSLTVDVEVFMCKKS